MGQPRCAIFTRNRGDIDNAPFTLSFQRRNSSLAGEKDPFDVDGKS